MFANHLPGFDGAPFALYRHVMTRINSAAIFSIIFLGLVGCAPTLYAQYPGHSGFGFSTGADRLPDLILQLEMQQTREQKFAIAAANMERKRQLDRDSDLLLKLATELNLRMSKVDDEPSTDAMTEIKLIEKLADGVKKKMKLAVAPK